MLRFGRPNRGDTIVEVLISIAVAGFAIGTSYALANQSLEHAISARERNQALNIVDNQIAYLKSEYQLSSDITTFDNGAFGTNGVSAVGEAANFCLKDGTSASPQTLPAVTSTNADDFTKYTGCTQPDPSSGISYYIDISPLITSTSVGKSPHTVYKIAVRWDQISSSQHNQASVYYRF